MANGPQLEDQEPSAGPIRDLTELVVKISGGLLGLSVVVQAPDIINPWLLRTILLVFLLGPIGWKRGLFPFLVWRHNRSSSKQLAAILEDVRKNGFSRSLKLIRRPSRWYKKRIPYDYFQYRTGNLARTGVRKHIRHMDEISDPLATAGRSMEGSTRRIYEHHSDQRGWAIWGPYLQLAERGRYLVVFRVRCQEQGSKPVKQWVWCDVHRMDVDSVGVKRYVDGTAYQPFCVEFEYDGDAYVQLRVHPDQQTEPDRNARANILVDSISVLRIDDLG